MHPLNALEQEWLRQLWQSKPPLKTASDPAFDHSPFLFKEDEARFENILRVHGKDGAEIIAPLFPSKLTYPHLVFDQLYTEQDYRNYFKNKFGITQLATDFDPNEERIPRGQAGAGRWTQGAEENIIEKTTPTPKASLSPERKTPSLRPASNNTSNADAWTPKIEAHLENQLRTHLENIPPEQISSFSEISEYIDHFIEENLALDTTDSLDLKDTLGDPFVEGAIKGPKIPFINKIPLSKTPIGKGLSGTANILLQNASLLLKHFKKKGWRFTTKKSLRFPLRGNLPPWFEQEGQWIGEAGSSSKVRMMEPSEDPYQSALNFVRSIRKFKAKQGISSKEIMDESYKENQMLKIKFDDNTYISIRKAGDSGSQTPNDQVTVQITGNISLWGKHGRKVKFPETKEKTE